MIKKLIFWYWRKYKHEVHPEEMYQVLKTIKKTYTKTVFGTIPKWELRKYTIAAEYALNKKTLEQIADEYIITRERIRQIMWRIYWDYKKGAYETDRYYN